MEHSDFREPARLPKALLQALRWFNYVVSEPFQALQRTYKYKALTGSQKVSDGLIKVPTRLPEVGLPSSQRTFS
jgi:hypothetical protein